MGKVTLGSQNSSIISMTYKSDQSQETPMPPKVVPPVIIEVPIIQYIDKIIEVPVIEVVEKIIEKIVEVPKEIIIEKIIEVPKEIIVEKIVEVPNYDLYDGAIIELDKLKRRHIKLKKQFKILIPIIAVVALIGYII